MISPLSYPGPERKQLFEENISAVLLQVKFTLFCHGSSRNGSDINFHDFIRKSFSGSLISLCSKDNVRAGSNLSIYLKMYISFESLLKK